MNVIDSVPQSSLAVYDIADITNRLAIPRQEIEHDFIQMGEKLIASTRLLYETSDAYNQMAGALAGPQISDLTDLLKIFSNDISKVNHTCSATQEFLNDLNSLTGQFSESIHILKRAVRTLSIFFVTARVTASVTGSEEINLVQFTDQFSELGSQLDGNVTSFVDAFKSMGSSLFAATSMNEKLAEQHAKLFDEITAEQTKNLETMESRRIWAEGRIATHGDRSLRITSRISRAVGNLQVGDSTRQRVEHVEETLQSLHEIDDEETVVAIRTLMSAQVSGAISDFDGEFSELVRSVDDLIEDTEALLERASEDSEMLLSSGDTALSEIDSSLQRTARMLEQYERGDAARAVAIDQVVSTVGKMLDHIGAFDEIRKNVRQLSLNSTLKARALDEDGRAFQQVASDLRALSDETNAPVEEMVKNLENSAALLRDFLESRKNGEEHLISEMQNNVSKASKCVSQIAGQLRLQAECMANTGPEALSQLNIAASTVHDRQDFCSEWRTVASELSTPSTDEDLRKFASITDNKFLSDAYEKFTMKAERDIYHNLFGADANSTDQKKDNSNQSEESGLDDIFF